MLLRKFLEGECKTGDKRICFRLVFFFFLFFSDTLPGWLPLSRPPQIPAAVAGLTQAVVNAAIDQSHFEDYESAILKGLLSPEPGNRLLPERVIEVLTLALHG